MYDFDQPQAETATPNQIDRLNELAALYLEAKEAEARANQTRIEIEEQIIEIMGVKTEGQHSYKTEFFKVVTKGNLSRKVDWAAFEKIKDKFTVDPPIKTKLELDLSAYKQLEKTDPENYKLMTLCVSTKPNKAGVTVEEI